MNVIDALNHDIQVWNEALWAACGPFRTVTDNDSPFFIGDIQRRSVAGLDVAEIKTNARQVFKPKQTVDKADDRSCFLVIQHRGTCRFELNGKSVTSRPGDIVLMDEAGDCSIEPQGLIDHVSISLERSRVIQMLKSRSISGKLDKDNPGTRLLKVFLHQLVSETGWSGASDDTSIQDSLLGLLKAAISAGTPLPDMLPATRKSTLRIQAESVIDRYLLDPELTPEKLAAALGVSTRKLYRAFENNGEGSICRYIQLERLKRCASDLSNPCIAHESITEIAFRWGFNDSAHFSKAFKRTFGASPRDYRQQSLFAIAV